MKNPNSTRACISSISPVKLWTSPPATMLLRHSLTTFKKSPPVFLLCRNIGKLNLSARFIWCLKPFSCKSCAQKYNLS